MSNLEREVGGNKNFGYHIECLTERRDELSDTNKKNKLWMISSGDKFLSLINPSLLNVYRT